MRRSTHVLTAVAVLHAAATIMHVNAALAGPGQAPAVHTDPAPELRGAPACTLRVLVAYDSETGHTQRMAAAAAEGAAQADGVEAALRPVGEVTADELAAADALILASPTHWANMSWPVARLIRDWPYMGDKVGAAIATGGAVTGGREHVVISLLLAMLNNGMVVVGPVYEEDGFRFGSFGAATVTGPRDPGVDDDALDDARRTGARVAEIAQALRASRDCASTPARGAGGVP